MVIPRNSPASNQRHQRQLSHKVRWAWDDGRGRGRGMETGQEDQKTGRRGGRIKKKYLINQPSYQWTAYLGYERRMDTCIR